MTEWGTKYINEYRIATRKMLGLNQERTLMSAIIPPKTAHINGIFGMCFKESKDVIFVNGLMNSLPYDYFVRALGKSNFRNDTANMLPVPNSKYDARIRKKHIMNGGRQDVTINSCKTVSGRLDRLY